MKRQVFWLSPIGSGLPAPFTNGTVAENAVNMKGLPLRVQLRTSPIVIGLTGFPQNLKTENHFTAKIGFYL